MDEFRQMLTSHAMFQRTFLPKTQKVQNKPEPLNLHELALVALFNNPELSNEEKVFKVIDLYKKARERKNSMVVTINPKNNVDLTLKAYKGRGGFTTDSITSSILDKKNKGNNFLKKSKKNLGTKSNESEVDFLKPLNPY